VKIKARALCLSFRIRNSHVGYQSRERGRGSPPDAGDEADAAQGIWLALASLTAGTWAVAVEVNN
jgi:hypothetical protein